MEKECKICKTTKPITEFFGCKACISGHLGVCKVCKKAGKTIRGENGAQHKFNIKWSKMDDNFMKMKFVTKEDYRSMYEFLNRFYDISQDIHKQFLDKWNATSKNKPLKYKNRGSNSINAYLFNGEPNPEYRKFKDKKNPTD